MNSAPAAAFLALAALLVATLAGCDNPQRTVDSLRLDIGRYQEAPTPELQTRIDAGFQQLDAEIQEARKRDETLLAQSLGDQRATLREQYAAAKLGKAMDDAKSALQGFGDALKQTGKDAADAVEQAVPTPPPDTE